MYDCPGCQHDRYWHETRRADRPDEFDSCNCLVCGCAYLTIVAWTA